MAGKAEYKNKWQKENCDRVNLTMAKGRKAIIQAHAEAQGESVNGFINRAIDNQIAQDGHKAPCEAREGPSGAGVVQLPSEAMQTAQEAAEAAGEALPVFVGRAVETQAKRDEAARKLGGAQ